MSEYNATCPFCGGENLRARVATVDTNVPLGPDGFDTAEGNPENLDVMDIRCGDCGKSVPVEHYYAHAEEEPCDCSKEAGGYRPDYATNVLFDNSEDGT